MDRQNSGFRVRGWLNGIFGLSVAFGAVSLAHAQWSPSDFVTPEFQASWGLGAVRAQYAYAMGYTGAGIKLGIADSPIQLTHPEFAGRIYHPSVFPPFPVPGFEIPDHGTHVMGLAVAARNSVGMMGVAYDASLASVVASPDEGYPESGDWAGELIDAGVSVMNGSFGPLALPPEDFETGEPNPDYRVMDFMPILDEELDEGLSAVRRLSQADVVMVFAAGNEYIEQPIASEIPDGVGMVPLITPARTRAGELYRVLADGDIYDPDTWEYTPMAEVEGIDASGYAGTLIAVVAVDHDNDIASFSNRCGLAADWCMSSPGVALYSTVPISTYAGGDEWSGTSMAAPLVAGGATLVRQAFPYLTARQVIEVVLTTATDLGDSSTYGHGLLNLERAVKGPIEFGHPSLIEGNESIFAPIFGVDTQGHDSVWRNDISGSGGFSKAGAGMLTLTGQNTYTGDTTITGGILRVDGSIASSDLTVGLAATLQGVGTVGNTVLAGVLSPGNSVGTLTVDGDLTLADGSTYRYEIDADQQGDLVVVSGTTTIADGAVFELAAADGVYLDQVYPMIESAALVGTFENLHTNYTFVDLDFVAEAAGGTTALGMVAERNARPMADFAQTNNQRAVANAIEGQRGGDEPYNDVILNTNSAQLSGWYQDWSGEIYSANQAALLYNSRMVAQVVNWRLQDSWLDATESARLQQVGQDASGTTVWAQAYGNWDEFSADANAQKSTASSGGLMLGVDHKVSPNLRLGGGMVMSNTSTSVAASRASTQGYGVMAYASYDTEAFRLNGGVVQSWNVADVSRTLPLDDRGNASGTVASRSTQLFADLSTPITIQAQGSERTKQHTTLSPFVQVSQTWLHTSNFGETGAEAGLSGQATNASTGFGTLGARVSHQWQSEQTHWQASLSLGWQRAWGDRSPGTTLAFATGPDFAVRSAAMARDAAVVELGVGASLGPSSRLNVVYTTTLSGQSSNQMLQAQLQWWF